MRQKKGDDEAKDHCHCNYVGGETQNKGQD